jgi:alpha-ketoglutarate-dependent taurine dioxygenase
LTGGCGAEVLGVDLKAMSNRQWDEVQAAFTEHGVIFFREQQLTPEQHLAFARRWAPIDVNRFFKHVEGYPEIAEVRKEPEQKTNIGGGWHTDHSYDHEPAMGSILLARELPDEGGDTLFANMYRAFETLSPGLQRTLETMNAVHGSAHIFGKGGVNDQNPEGKSRYGNQEKVGADVVHPVVIKHPLSGRKSLYVNPAFTLRFENWSAEDSRPLLEHLYRHASRPEFTCRFRWREGSIAFWDNRATWHYAANDYHGERRLMHRITVAGCALEAAV